MDIIKSSPSSSFVTLRNLVYIGVRVGFKNLGMLGPRRLDVIARLTP